ncbi:hypothetical protein [Cryptosporangium minutisporangium]|uniref:hypothetical protein n=1 Tax=Cryptosporangium minutisporangium TaxID=113569 RepID=UPI0031E8CAB8
MPPDEIDGLCQRLKELVATSSYFDKAWIVLSAGDPSRDNDEGYLSARGYVALLTRAQLSVAENVEHPRDAMLDNRRIVRPVSANLDIARTETLEYQGARYSGNMRAAPLRNNEELFTMHPSTEFGGVTRSKYSYYCLLNPIHRGRFSKPYIFARNLFLDLDYPSLHASLPLRAAFDNRVPKDRAVMDQTTLFAIGLPQGEPVGLTPGIGRSGSARSTLFGSRHAVVRVGRTAVVDVEKPVTRLPEEVLDLLGLDAGSRVIVESAHLTPQGPTVNRMTLWRERSPLLIARTQTGVPDNQELVEDEDFPVISLDLASRQQLGVSQGAAVYVRPAVSSVLAREFTAMSFILVGAIFSAAALQSISLALISALIYVV